MIVTDRQRQVQTKPIKLTGTSDHDGVSSTDSVGEEGGEWQTTETTDGLNGVEETESSTLWVTEVVFPGVEDPKLSALTFSWIVT